MHVLHTHTYNQNIKYIHTHNMQDLSDKQKRSSEEGEAGGQKAKATQRESKEYSPIGMTIPRTATVMLLPMR